MLKALKFIPRHILLIFSLCCLLCIACGTDNNTKDDANTTPIEEPKAEEEVAAPISDATAEVDSSALLAENLAAEEAAAAAEVEEKKAEEARAAEKKAEEKKKRRERRKRRPKMKFEKTTHDYGLIMQGDKVEYQFKFTNVGKTDLVVKDATATCGCTRPSYPFVPIPPGEEGYIGVVFDSKGKLGKQKPAITIVTNASPKTYKLYLDGFVDAQREEDVKEKTEEEGVPE